MSQITCLIEEVEFLSKNKSNLIEAYQEYVKQLEANGERWVVADNPVEARDSVQDLSEQQQRLDAVFNTIKTGESQSDYDDLIVQMPEKPIQRMQYKFEKYIASLTYDIREKLPVSLRCKFDRMLIAFQPTGYTNAQALVSHPDGSPLEGGLIFLNQGLYFSAGFAAKAIVLANVQGDHSFMQKEAKPALIKGVEFYLSRSPALADSEFHATGNPTEEGELSTHISSVKAMMFEFIILHEFAHIVLNHHAYNEATRLTIFSEADEKNDLDSAVDKTQAAYWLEYEADRFAIDIITSASTNPQSKLANLYAIGAFFVFLECIESQLKRGLSKTHPAPLDRLQKLADYVQNESDEDLDFRPLQKELLSLCENWSSEETLE